MSNSTDQQKNNVKVGWESPSNIALIKYWGKYGRQLPRNPSVSFTLSKAATRTFVEIIDKNTSNEIALTFLFEGKENYAFTQRIERFLNSICDEYLPFLKTHKILIESSNSFPHSSGIASSASGMSALALCLLDIQNGLQGKNSYDLEFYQKSSEIARLGSGSASRSIFPFMAVWGIHNSIYGSSNDYAVGIEEEVHPVFKTMHNDILIISSTEKSVSSTAGHQLMEGNPYAPIRYQQASDRMAILLSALKTGDIKTFGKITEDEALTLHALMMCSDPSYILMEEASLTVIKYIKAFREETGIPVFFTLDAGPNVHVLYPAEFEEKVSQFIIKKLKPICHEGKIIRDKVGKGSIKII